MSDDCDFRQCPDALIDAIYGSLTQEAPWTDALELLRVAMESNVACLRISVKGPHPREYLFAAGPIVSRESIAEWEARSAREMLPVPLVAGEPQFIDWSQIASSTAVREMLERSGVRYSVAVLIHGEDGIEYTLCANRGASATTYRAEELALLRAAGRHFSRALALRQELLKACVVNEFQSDTLDRLGVAAILVGTNGHITVLNDTARRMLANSEWLRLRSGRLHAVDERDDRTFQSLLKEILTFKTGGRSRAMLVQHGGSERELNLLVTGCKLLSAVSGRADPGALVFLGRATVANDADLEVLQELFSFTRAEAKLALGLAKGLPLGDVESELNIRHNTARAHLRSMFVKADVNRQSELIHLLANSLAPLGRPLHQASAIGARLELS